MPSVKNTSSIALISISASTITYTSGEVKPQSKGYFSLIEWESKEEYKTNLNACKL